jgi:cell division protease FtsH
LGGGHDEREQTLNQLLLEMDGFGSNEGVILIAATSRPDVLDPALLRPGRFDRQVVVPVPDINGRFEILKVHAKDIPLDETVDLKIIAKGTPGFAGAELANLLNEASLIAARKDKDKVSMKDIEDAKDKIMMGKERRSMVMSDEDKKITAYHEAGHAIVAKLIPDGDPVHKVSIIPRGRALGVTMFLPDEDKYSYSKSYCEAKICSTMGGRAAEEIIYNHLTTGASNDIQQATELARKMVCFWGMSEKLGPLMFGKKEDSVFLGRDFATHNEFSEKTAVIIDEEIRRIVEENYKKAINLLNEHIEVLHKTAKLLLEKETINGSEIDIFLKGQDIENESESENEAVNKED